MCAINSDLAEARCHKCRAIFHYFMPLWYNKTFSSPDTAETYVYYVFGFVGFVSGTKGIRIKRVRSKVTSGAHGQYIPEGHVTVPHTGPSRHTNRRKLIKRQRGYGKYLLHY